MENLVIFQVFQQGQTTTCIRPTEKHRKNKKAWTSFIIYQWLCPSLQEHLRDERVVVQSFYFIQGEGLFSRADSPRRLKVSCPQIVINPFRKNHFGTVVSKILQYRHTHTYKHSVTFYTLLAAPIASRHYIVEVIWKGRKIPKAKNSLNPSQDL